MPFIPSAALVQQATLSPSPVYQLVNGAKAATLPRWVSLNSPLSLTSGTLYLFGIVLNNGETYTSISFITDAAGASMTHQIFGIFDDSLGSTSATPYALLRGTNDDTSAAWTQNTVKTLNLTSTYAATRTGVHYLGILVTSTVTQPTLRGVAPDTIVQSLASILTGPTSSTGLTALPDPGTAPNGNGPFVNAWVS